LCETTAQGICDKTPRFRVVLPGIAVVLDNDLVISIHEVLVPIETEIEKKYTGTTCSSKRVSNPWEIKYGCTKFKDRPKNVEAYKIPTLLL